ncbi:MAG: endonuclease MutS2 [Sulfurovum sp.]|nr:endonuclease MutS2 [Sulfurovum sp.]
MTPASLAHKLDLDTYIGQFEQFLARPKPIIIEGDIHQHHRYIKALSTVEFPPLKALQSLDSQLARLRKQAILSLDELYAFTVIISYFNRLKSIFLPEPLSSWIHGMEIHDEIRDVLGDFTDEGEINPEKEPELREIDHALGGNRRAIKDALYSLTHSSKLSDYLVDTQVHFHSGEDTLLVRGGFSQAIKASIVGRSSAAFFYIVPEQISKLKEQQQILLQRKEDVIWRYCKIFSEIFHRWEPFLGYINKEYDRFDHYQARVNFAKTYDYVFILPTKEKGIVLDGFVHPAIDNPVPISITLDKSIMLITGVNAGGKTMLLKSMLSAVYMSKYLLPFSCNSSKTRIGSYKNIEAIIDDPQSVKNDISTFAGRMLEFSKLFRQKDTIVGVDEIELGTDADEAAALFKVMLEELKKRGNTFIVTTHHKRLASLMADDDEVELIAALYDEQKRLPTYTFLQGSIGKSYAFETAERYGISPLVIERAKEFFGEDKERLGELIEKSTTLEREMRLKIVELDTDREKLEKKQKHLGSLAENMQEEQQKVLATLENRYNAATKLAQQALKSKESTDGRRLLNEAYKHKQKAQKKSSEKPVKFIIGDRVKYRSHRGEIVSIKAKEATIVIDGMKMRVPLQGLTKSLDAVVEPKPKQVKITTTVEKSTASISIKLLGMYGDEAIERLDKFLSDAFVNGLDSVEVIHGTGGGILARLVTEYLELHPKIQRFYRVPGNLGATIVEL